MSGGECWRDSVSTDYPGQQSSLVLATANIHNILLATAIRYILLCLLLLRYNYPGQGALTQQSSPVPATAETQLPVVREHCLSSAIWSADMSILLYLLLTVARSLGDHRASNPGPDVLRAFETKTV